MTYYEIVKLIDDSRDAPINDQLITTLNTKLSYEGNAKARLSNHVVDLVSYRINQAITELIMWSGLNNKEEFSLRLIKTKNEIAYCYKLTNTNFLSTVSAELIKSLNDFINNAINELKNTFIASNNSEIIMMINSDKKLEKHKIIFFGLFPYIYSQNHHFANICIGCDNRI